MSEKVTCETCGCVNSHTLGCAEQSREELIQYAQGWMAEYQRATGELRAVIRRQNERVTFWQGKFRIVKHENNALRRKVEGRKDVEAAVRARLLDKGKLDAIRLYRDRTGAALKDAKLYVESLQSRL